MSAGRKLSLKDHTERERKKAASKGSRGNWAGRLKNWHSKDALTKTKSGEKVGTIDVLLATQAPLVELAVHSWPKIITQKDKDGGKEETNCFNTDYNCFEDLGVVESQFRYDDAGNREVPPVVCPHCRLVDWLRQQIEAEELSWTDFAFKYKSDKASVSLRAGGVCGMFGGWDLSDEDKETLRDAGVNLRDAYRENATGKVKFIYCVVDLGDLDKGLQATVESKSLGQQLSALIDQRSDEFGERGDPITNPYPFRWRFWPERKPADMYDVSPLSWDDLEGTGYKGKANAIELAGGTKIPAVFEQLRKYPNVKQLRSQMEQFCVLDDVPWDEIFAPVEALADEKGWVVDADEKAADEESTSFPRVDGKDDPNAPADDTVDCGACGKPVDPDAPSCKHCGAEFAEEAEAPAPKVPSEPPPPPKAQAEVAKAKSAVRSGGKRGGGRGGVKSKVPEGKTPEEVHGDDDLPWT